MKRLKYSCAVGDNMVKLYINGMLHVMLKQDDMIGLMSWITGEKTKLYHIEFYFTKNYFYVEYDCFEKWQSVLQILDSNVKLNNVVT